MNQLFYLLAFTALAKITECRLEPLPDEHLSRESLVQCITKACQIYVKSGDIIKLSLTLTEVDKKFASVTVMDRLLLKALFDSDKWQVVIKKANEVFYSGKHFKSVSNYIIQVRQENELKDHLEALQQSQDWNPHANFWIFSARPFNDTLNIIKNFTNILWSFKITNGIIYQPRHEEVENYDVFSYFPYRGNYCGDPSESVKIIDSCSFGNYKLQTDLFGNKIPKNLHGCKVRVRAIVFPPYAMAPEKKRKNKQMIFREGLEISLMNFIANVSNFRIDYSAAISKSDWGVIDENGVATGSLLYLKEEFVDIVIGAFSVTLERLKYYDIVAYDFLEDITLCVPHALEKSQWEKLLDVMTIEAWGVVVAGFLLVSFSLWGFSVLNVHEHRFFKELKNDLQTSLAVLVSIPVFQPTTFKIRMILFVWILFCLHATVAYQTYLMSFLTKPKYRNQINSIDDISTRNYSILLLPNTERYFYNQNDKVSKLIQEKMMTCNDVPACLRRVAYERDAVMGSPRLYMKYALNTYRSRDGQPLLFCFKNSLVTYSLGMLMWKGFPLKPVLSSMVSKLTSAGFIMKWEKEIFAAKLKNETEETMESNETLTHHKLSVLDLEAVFILWIVGNTLGFIIFLGEIYHFRRTKKKKILNVNTEGIMKGSDINSNP